MLTYEDALAEVERAGLPLAGDNGRRETLCPDCGGLMTITRRNDGGADHSCANGCAMSRIADAFHFRTTPRATVQAENAKAAHAEFRELLSLGDIEVVSAIVTGQGSRASAEIKLSNGDTMEFESLRELANPTLLAAELAACAGVLEPVTKATALKAVALLRRLAQRNATITDNDLAIDWGMTYLQSMQERDVDLSDQADRWEAFADMRSMDHARSEAGGHGTSLVLVDTDGQRYVRTGNFFAFVRSRDGSVSEAKIAQRMLRVGWYKRNASGRIKATSPHMPEEIGWNFFAVPADWSGSRVHAGREVTRAHEAQPRADRNHREPVNLGGGSAR